jgi:cytochrome o ubiquinol oxidase subunit I
VLPHVAERDTYWRMKQSTRAKPNEPEQVKYESIEMPRSSATGFVNAFFAVITGFALIWHIWWMASLGIFGGFVTVLVFTFRETEEIEVPAEQLAQFDRNRTRQAEVTL